MELFLIATVFHKMEILTILSSKLKSMFETIEYRKREIVTDKYDAQRRIGVRTKKLTLFQDDLPLIHKVAYYELNENRCDEFAHDIQAFVEHKNIWIAYFRDEKSLQHMHNCATHLFGDQDREKVRTELSILDAVPVNMTNEIRSKFSVKCKIEIFDSVNISIYYDNVAVAKCYANWQKMLIWEIFGANINLPITTRTIRHIIGIVGNGVSKNGSYTIS